MKRLLILMLVGIVLLVAPGCTFWNCLWHGGPPCQQPVTCAALHHTRYLLRRMSWRMLERLCQRLCRRLCRRLRMWRHARRVVGQPMAPLGPGPEPYGAVPAH